MTIIACFSLRKVVKREGRTDPAQILKRLGFLVKTTLRQDTDYALSDGLDGHCAKRTLPFLRCTDYCRIRRKIGSK
ncbi:hypothetical protein QUF80_12285 [Desulfococcaceae bacterium HSG8]|nr:hypothetical protein [Desulfococcaceae bacterium HSG8]